MDTLERRYFDVSLEAEYACSEHDLVKQHDNLTLLLIVSFDYQQMYL